jgi:hypothetical protein
VTAAGIDRAAFVALALLVVGYSIVIGDATTPSAGWAWLGVALILLAASAARLRIGARPSRYGAAVGLTSLLLGLLRISGAIAEVTPPLALATVSLPIVAVRLLRR